MLSLSGCLLQHNDPQFPIKWGYLYLRAVNILPSIAPTSELEDISTFKLKTCCCPQPRWQNVKLMSVFYFIQKRIL